MLETSASHAQELSPPYRPTTSYARPYVYRAWQRRGSGIYSTYRSRVRTVHAGRYRRCSVNRYVSNIGILSVFAPVQCGRSRGLLATPFQTVVYCGGQPNHEVCGLLVIDGNYLIYMINKCNPRVYCCILLMYFEVLWSGLR